MIINKTINLCACIVMSLFIFANAVLAEKIDKIEISGNERIAKNTILQIIDEDKDLFYTPKEINAMQKKLIETNFFNNVNLKIENNILYIKVKENPLINFFTITGVKNKGREDLIYNSISIAQSKVFSESLLKKEINNIKNIYENEGYFEAEVTPQISLLPGNSLNLIIQINEGEKFKTKKISFVGDKYFKPSQLIDAISSSEHGWWKFLSSSSTTNINRIEYDKFLLKNFYLNEGFYDVQILSSDVSLSSKNEAEIIFSINSGKKYSFSKYNVIDENNNLSLNDKNYINNLLKKRINGSYSLKKINDLKDDIFRYLNIRKIEFLTFKVDENKFKDENIVLTVRFINAERKFVNLINIKGNSITEEEVIRRNLNFSEGDSFSSYKLDKSLDNLKVLGIFKDIKINTKELNNEKVNLDIVVEEQPTGTISAGVGVGSEGSVVSTAINEKNLFGKGINLNSNVSLGTQKISGNINANIPDFRNTDNDLIASIFAISTDFENAGYESKKIGNNIAVKYDLLEDLSFNIGGGIDYDKIDTNDTASQLYKSREGNFLTYKTFYNLETDKRDRKFQPTKGHKFGFGQTLALPGSDVSYLANNIYGTYYYPVSKDYIVNFKSGLSTINAINDKDVKLSDRKFLSSRNLRGFESYGVGPIDNNDHIGGNYSAYASFSSSFPNPLPEKWNANSSFFLDLGNVWGVDFDSSKDSNKLRSSIGAGLDWVSPLGPLSFVFAQTLSSAEGDIEESFNFQIGSSF